MAESTPTIFLGFGYRASVEFRNDQNQKRIVPTASAVLDDGMIVEMVYRPDLRQTLFAIYSAGRWTLQDVVDIGPTRSSYPSRRAIISS